MSDLHGDDAGDGAAEGGVHPQFAMFEIIDGFQDHDALGLRSLTPAGRAKQLAARQELYDYLTDLWEHAKQVGEQPGGDPRFLAVAALRDLAESLRSAAWSAKSDADD
jgi:hypothetical protein